MKEADDLLPSGYCTASPGYPTVPTRLLEQNPLVCSYTYILIKVLDLGWEGLWRCSLPVPIRTW